MFITKNNKSPFFQLVYFVNGKRTTASTKTTIESEALVFMESFQTKPIVKEEKSFTPIKLSKFQKEYLEYVKTSKSKHYVRSIDLAFRMLIKFYGDGFIHELRLRDADKFISSTFSKTERAAALYYRTLKAAFSKAELWEYIEKNPFKSFKLPKMKKTLPLFINQEEFSKILENTESNILKCIFKTAFLTGFRLGELVNMRWDWVDFSQSQITTKCSDDFQTKSKSERTVPINDDLKNLLIEIYPKIFSIKKSNYVFCIKKGIRLNEDFVSKKFKKAVLDAELDKEIHFHTLRHSYASRLVQKGASLKVVQELLGHEQISTTEIYSHLQQQNLRDAVNLL
ncbi:MAG: site-specific integrase [Melioribacteraceae bacterium]